MPRAKSDDPFLETGEAQVSFDKVKEILMKAREHRESVDRMEPDFNVFMGCTFPAHCRDLKWNRNGTLVIPLEVGYRYISLAQNMIYSSGVPLAVSIERYSPRKVLEQQVKEASNGVG